MSFRRAARTPISRFLVAAVAVAAGTAARADDWPQWLGPQRDGVWREKGLAQKFPAGGPRVQWRTPLGAGFSAPAVAGERVFVMDRKPAEAGAKSPPRIERVLCLNAADGKLLWKHEYECSFRVSYGSGPRTMPLVHGGHVYTLLGTMGDLLCLDAATGKVCWSKKLGKEYKAPTPVWGWSAQLLIDGGLLYTLVGGSGSAVVAFHKDSGKEAWRALTTKEICYSPPMIYVAGGKRQLIVWLCESVNGLDPATGNVYWTVPYPVSSLGPAVNIATVRQTDGLLFLSSAYEGSTAIQLATDRPAATRLWQTTEKQAEAGETLNVLMSTPVVHKGYAYGVGFMGSLICVETKTGQIKWQTYAATGGKKTDCGTAFLVQQGEAERCVLFNDHGDLILADLSPRGYQEIARAHILEPVQKARNRLVVWSCPAFAHRCVFARNDREMVCVSLAAEERG